ncbi:DUF2946 family protein [Aquabacterium sp.]|uniref:DUF2946 family protein n=1 Tax=Aquabacterium sp. TaxID=1872578 RepID=UPI0039C8582D
MRHAVVTRRLIIWLGCLSLLAGLLLPSVSYGRAAVDPLGELCSSRNASSGPLSLPDGAVSLHDGQHCKLCNSLPLALLGPQPTVLPFLAVSAADVWLAGGFTGWPQAQCRAGGGARAPPV